MRGKMGKQTTAVHGGGRKDDAFGAVNEPIYMTSNYRIPTDGTPVDWSGTESNIYARNRNVNQMVPQDKLCALTGAEDCAVFGSGVAALAGVFTTFLDSGDHVVVSEVCYSATNLLFRDYLPKKYGIDVTFVDTTDTEAVREAIGPKTRLVHVETPGNPTTEISDVEAIAASAHESGALVSVDATFAGPICIYPLKLGADLEIHSMTKYINGHGDSLGGCVLGRKELLAELKELAMVNYGGILSPFNAWLISRGLVTLPIRMAQHGDTAMAVARFLEKSPAVRFVWYPGLESHPQRERAEKLMKGRYSGMIAFDIEGDDMTHQRFLDELKLVTHAVSLGDTESLIVYYDKNSDKLPHYPEIFRKGFFRFSIGLEDGEDIIEDMEQAFQACGLI
ncbi:aminotransferase class I/II-fold pyridoxal phosphate-dependent enzyme [Dethiosulfovibrio sp. F2B]|uniref:trans-sulfuration enzyme family protein n=1 Tax=Dethiosulfovibrio faecalis TaxID=2720018 RepID=UPI001F2F4D17|nr:aminotransferase class I/II-fold pyridoxal phosphate-dependent enzyme [Dethiosulfovibrio faecalis]MCF4152301.1 aminotransferase class I/II-fold pyridoxal phosphate-dependent enzyme [Dethiosulfovibrio faecalis]